MVYDMSSTQRHQETVNTQGLACAQNEISIDASQILVQMAFANFRCIQYTDPTTWRMTVGNSQSKNRRI